MKWFKSLMFLFLVSLIFVSSLSAKMSRKEWLFNLPSGKLCEMVVPYNDVAAASATAYKNTAISTSTLAGHTTVFLLANGNFTDIVTPRNVVAVLDFASGTATTTVVGTLTLKGTNVRGIYTEETLTVSTNTATGNVAWRTITEMDLAVTSISGASEASANVKIGSGVKIGLPNDILVTGDIHKVIEAGSLTTTYSVSTTYDTITFVNAPDGSKDYQVWMNVSQW